MPHNTSGYPIPIRCSPLIAGTPGGTGYVFFGADDGVIRVLNADTGALVNSQLGGVTLGGEVRAGLAAFKGRLYALTVTGHLYCFKQR